LSHISQMRDDGHFLREVQNAIRTGDSDRMQTAIGEYATYCNKELQPDALPFPAPVLGELQRTMLSAEFLKSPEPFHLLLLFEHDWALLTSQQRAELLTTLRALLNGVRDPDSMVVVIELFGEYFADGASLDALGELSRSARTEVRELVPDGLQRFCRISADVGLNTRARRLLEELAGDESPQVRAEARAALSRLGP
jgi:hypothetical protein